MGNLTELKKNEEEEKGKANWKRPHVLMNSEKGKKKNRGGDWIQTVRGM